MSLQTRLERLEADRNRQCAQAWQRMVDLFRTLPLDVLEALVYGRDAEIPPAFDDALAECTRLMTPDVEAWLLTITPPGHPLEWTDAELSQYFADERAALR